MKRPVYVVDSFSDRPMAGHQRLLDAADFRRDEEFQTVTSGFTRRKRGHRRGIPLLFALPFILGIGQ